MQYHNQMCNYAILQSIVQLCNMLIPCAMLQVGGLSSVSGLSLPLGPVTRLSAGKYSYLEVFMQVFIHISISIHASINVVIHQYQCSVIDITPLRGLHRTFLWSANHILGLGSKKGPFSSPKVFYYNPPPPPGPFTNKFWQQWQKPTNRYIIMRQNDAWKVPSLL